MAKSKKIVVKGIEYKSIAEAYRALKPEGISLEAVVYRIRKGQTPDEAFSSGVWGGGIEVFGVKYRSILEAYNEIKPDSPIITIRQRIVDQGWTADEAFSGVKRGVSDIREVTILGNRYSSIKYAYRKIKPNVSYTTIRIRIMRGMTLDEAFGTGPQNCKPVVVKGKQYESEAEAYRELQPSMPIVRFRNLVRDGLDYNACTGKKPIVTKAEIQEKLGAEEVSKVDIKNVREQIKRGKSLDEALAKKAKIVYKGKEYKNMASVVRAANTGVGYGTVRDRLALGVSLERALEPERIKLRTMEPKPITVNGKEYSSMKEAYRDIKPEAAYGTVTRRLREGASPEEAFQTIRKK